MLAALSLITLAAFAQPIDTVYVLPGTMRAGRHPIPSDPVIEALVKGSWQPPADARAIKSNAEGWFEDRALRSAYVYMPVEATSDGTVLLDAAGHTMVYVNGVPRGGDPYGFGYLTLPIRLHKGRNDLLFVSGRGRIRAAIQQVQKPVEFDVRDLTSPDVLTTDRGRLEAAIVVRNASEKDLTNLEISAKSAEGREVRSKLPRVPGESIRKVPFNFEVPGTLPKDKVSLTVRLLQGGNLLDEKTVDIRVRDPKQTYKRTFRSRVDDSVQYYVVNPAQKPSKSNALVLSVHGASVEATNQADAYKSKDDVTIVAATNRRPYGFDWEDWGRIDALEVLSIAKRTIPHDPASVHITGHSMGGHGTWYLGTLYPDLFASVSPAAGWISFWSYGGGWDPENPTPTEQILRRSMNASDVLARLQNTQAQGLFVLHGDADESVPVSEARHMKEELTKIGHKDFGYHEVPGAGHWWSNEAVDWPGIFDVVRRRRLDPNPDRIDFTTPNPAVSAHMAWATVEQQEKPLEPSRIRLSRSPSGVGWTIEGTTTNVAKLRLAPIAGQSVLEAQLDGQSLKPRSKGSVVLTKVDGRWTESDHRGEKSSQRSGPFKQAFDRNMAFVYGTHGTPEENEWARNKARFDAETWYYRGNGSVDVLPDTEADGLGDRNLILYGNARTNSVIANHKSDLPVSLEDKGSVAALFIAPLKGSERMASVIGGTDLVSMRRTDRLPYLGAGTAYPDWILFDGEGIVGDGFYGNDWKVDPATSAWRK
jgi:pimeloyl-ACP methyl ester carboxylesterase